MPQSFKSTLLTLALALFASSQARADSVGTADVHFDGDGPFAYVDLTYQGNYAAGYIGVYDWSVNNDQTGKLPQHFTTFCYDVMQDIYFGGDYTYDLHPLADGPDPSLPNYSQSTAKEISALWNEHSDDLYDSNNQPNLQNAASFQVAVWSILYGNDISYGNYSFVSTGLDWATQAKAANLDSIDPSLWLLTNPTAQDQLVFIPGQTPPPTAVPLPNSALGGGVLLALYFAKRIYRRRELATQLI